MAASRLDSLERIEVASRAELRRWLEENHTRTESVWLVYYKKTAGERYLPYDSIVEEALCFGWIDGLARRLDEERSMLLFSPRRPKSVWSQLNKDRVSRLIAGRRMTPDGLQKIEEAKLDGSWDVFSAAERLEIPPDLQKAFREKPGTRAKFDALTVAQRKRVLGALALLKGPDSRARRIQSLLEMLTTKSNERRRRPESKRK